MYPNDGNLMRSMAAKINALEAKLVREKARNADLLQKTQQLEARLGEAKEVARYIMESDTGDGGYMRIISSDIADKLRRIAGV
jgi:hypothetical protein